MVSALAAVRMFQVYGGRGGPCVLPNIIMRKITRREFFKVSAKAAALYFLGELLLLGDLDLSQESDQSQNSDFYIPYKPFNSNDLYIKHNLTG